MVSGDDNFEFVGEGGKPVKLFLEFGVGALISEVTGVEEDIGEWYKGCCIVRIGDAGVGDDSSRFGG